MGRNTRSGQHATIFAERLLELETAPRAKLIHLRLETASERSSPAKRGNGLRHGWKRRMRWERWKCRNRRMGWERGMRPYSRVRWKRRERRNRRERRRSRERWVRSDRRNRRQRDRC